MVGLTPKTALKTICTAKSVLAPSRSMKRNAKLRQIGIAFTLRTFERNSGTHDQLYLIIFW
jgi:hypothetical protein